MMEQVPLGSSDLRVSPLAYGCWRIAGPEGVDRPPPDQESRGRTAVLAAHEAGINFFDHADVYSNTAGETLFGQVLKENPGLKRDLHLASKCGIRKAGEPDQKAPYRYDFSRNHIIRSCEASLKRLGVETIDLYQLHRPDFLCDPQEVAGAFEELRQTGKVREFGVSNFQPSQLETLQAACPMPLIVNQVEISLLKIDALLDGTLNQCLTRRMTPLAWSPLGGGRLFRLPSSGHSEKPTRHTNILKTLDEIARERDTSATAIALSWLMKHPARIVPIIGSTEPARIREGAKAAEIELSREEWYRLMEAAYGGRLP